MWPTHTASCLLTGIALPTCMFATVAGAPPSWLSSTLKVQCRPFYCIHQGSSVTTASVENWLSELFADKRMDGFDSVHCQGSNGVFTHAWVNFHNPGAAAAARTAVRGQCLSLQSTSGQMVLWQLFVSFQRTGTGQANSSAGETIAGMDNCLLALA